MSDPDPDSNRDPACVPAGDPESAGRFERAKQHFFDGLGCYQAGRVAEAEQHYLASLALLPGRVSTLVNLAAARLQLGRAADALTSADVALAIEVNSDDALLHRASALLALGRLAESVAGFDRLLARDDHFAEGWLRRGHALLRLGRAADALASYQRVLALDPASADAWTGSGSLLREMGRADAAAQAFREALRHGADPALHAYYLGAVSGGAPPASAPEAYVQGLFDSYAGEFDSHLIGTLGYRAHRQLVDGLAGLHGGRFESVLDLGCGTGLCGSLLRPVATRLVGVDLSAAMLQHAGALGIYDQLAQRDLLGFLRDTDQHFDLVLAADVFIYVGDLEPVFAAVRRVMTRGLFCFSVEPALGEAAFVLQPSLRYAHTEVGLRRLAAAHGFEVLAFTQAPIRQDQREAVDGRYVYLRAG